MQWKLVLDVPREGEKQETRTESKRSYIPEKCKTTKTASVLKQDPNTSKGNYFKVLTLFLRTKHRGNHLFSSFKTTLKRQFQELDMKTT